MKRSAFTLIELLVVIAIIAILAAILFPVFAQAKLAAKKTAELSNAKNLGIGLQIYLSDSDDTYPSGNFRVAANGSSTEGELHWSYVLDPYVKNKDVWVSPADPNGGWAPTCYNAATNNSGKGAPAGQAAANCVYSGYNAGIYTAQVPRLSYTANQMILPRKRSATDTSNVISATAIDDVSGTILIAPTTDSTQCMSNGGEYKSYRGALGVRDSANLTNSFSAALPATSQLWALNQAEIDGITKCKKGPGSTDHVLRYTNAGRFNLDGNGVYGGNNYVMADTSAKFRDFKSTFNPSRFLWGKQGYSIGGAAVLDRTTGRPVQ